MTGLSFAEVNGTVLNSRNTGPRHGPAVLMVDSLGTDHRIWNAVAAILADRHRVVCYDKRGHGLSGPADGSGSLDRHPGDLPALARHPGRVLAAVLCDTAVRIIPAGGHIPSIEQPNLVARRCQAVLDPKFIGAALHG